MKEVIKSGKFEDKYETTCNNCDCVFSFSYRDTYCPSYWMRYRVVDCPECESEVCTDILKDE